MSDIGVVSLRPMEPHGRDSELPWQPTELQRIINYAPALILTAQPDGTVDFFNRSWFDFVGVPIQKLVGWAGPSTYIRTTSTSFLNGGATPYGPERPSGLNRVSGAPMASSAGCFITGSHSERRKAQFYGGSDPALTSTPANRPKQNCKRPSPKINRLKDQLYKENIALREQIDKTSLFEEIVGSSPALNTVLARVAKVGPTDSTVLILGETGTGKELIARAIHKRSRRSAKPFVSVNCAAIPRDLIGSELFGHEKGAFTGATQRRLGHFELAEGGTIFLDEVGDLPHETQVALLRVLQEREFERVGGNSLIRAEVRVIAATNRDLEAAMTNGGFRSDLFYRLNVFPVETPPLRERQEDIPLLVEYFVDRYARKTGKTNHAVGEKL